MSSVLGKPVGQAHRFRRETSWRSMMMMVATGNAWTGRKATRARFTRARTLSGSGDAYYHCDHHYEAYAARLQPVMDDIGRRYPAMAPADFDPDFAGESWDGDGW